MKILIIEDNNDLLEVLYGMLTDKGYTVACKNSLFDAKKYIENESPLNLDVVLIDFLLQGASSEELVKLIIEKEPGARIIMTSADTKEMKKNMENFFSRKAIDAVIEKPYNLNVLLNLINEFGAS